MQLHAGEQPSFGAVGLATGMLRCASCELWLGATMLPALRGLPDSVSELWLLALVPLALSARGAETATPGTTPAVLLCGYCASWIAAPGLLGLERTLAYLGTIERCLQQLEHGTDRSERRGADGDESGEMMARPRPPIGLLRRSLMRWVYHQAADRGWSWQTGRAAREQFGR